MSGNEKNAEMLQWRGALFHVGGSGVMLAKAIRNRNGANEYASDSLFQATKRMANSTRHRAFIDREVKRQIETSVRALVAARITKMTSSLPTEDAKLSAKSGIETSRGASRGAKHADAMARLAGRRVAAERRADASHGVGHVRATVCGRRDRMNQLLATYETMVREPWSPSICYERTKRILYTNSY